MLPPVRLSWRLEAQGAAPRDRGTVAVITALLMSAVMVVAAIVIDFGLVRAKALSAQTAADLAAIAGGSDLAARNPFAACVASFQSLQANLIDLPPIAPSVLCLGMGGTVCNAPAGSAQATATVTRGRYVLSVRYPVPNAEITDGRYGAGLNDGEPCERLKVSVTSAEPVFFGAVLGRDGYEVIRSATIRARYSSSSRVPALWLLDPWGCTSLAVSGGGHLTVGSLSPVVAGIIAVDSDGSACGGSQRTVSSSGAGTSVEAVPLSGSSGGAIELFAQPRNAAACTGSACDPSDVSAGRLSPQPVHADARATRQPVDWRYNCRAAYPPYHGLSLPGCPYATPAYLDNLAAAIGSSGIPTGFQRWTSAGHSCSPSGALTVTGNWWIDCPAGLSIGNGTTLTFENSNLVLDAGVSMTGGALRINTANTTSHLPTSCLPPAVTIPCTTQTSAAAAFMYLRSGSINITGGSYTAYHVTTILAAGYIKITGGAPPTWLAPTEGPFSNLSLWSELSSNKFNINGGANAELTGTFFTPEAKPFALSGGGDWGQQHAQFISHQLVVSGGGVLTLAPNPAAVKLPEKDIRLIR